MELGRDVFQGITARHKRRRGEARLAFLRRVRVHYQALGDVLVPDELRSVALATRDRRFAKGDAVAQQGLARLDKKY